MPNKTALIQDLRTGMYVSKLDISWFCSPFWRRTFTIEHEEQIERLRRAGVKSVEIDASRGEDTNAPKDEPTQVVPNSPLAPPTSSKSLVQLDREFTQVKSARRLLEGTVQSLFTLLEERGTLESQHAEEAAREIAIATRTLPNSVLFMALSQDRCGNFSPVEYALSTCTLSLLSGQTFGYNPLELHELATAALLHAIGLAQVSPDIIGRCASTSDSLSDRERKLLQNHPNNGVLALEQQGGFGKHILQAIYEHHAFLDGSGYPNGIRGEFISQRSRIVMVMDRYDELITVPLTPYEALQRLYREAQEGMLDQDILSRFINLVDVYPVRSTVALNTGERALVTDFNSSALHLPIIAITHGPDGNELPTSVSLHLAQQPDHLPHR